MPEPRGQRRKVVGLRRAISRRQTRRREARRFMIASMTGFGVAQRCVAGVHFALEMRSVNHRYFKASIKLPDGVNSAEPAIESQLRRKLTRGSVSLTLRIRNRAATAAYDINQGALSAYADALGQLDRKSGVDATIDLATLATLPGVCQLPDMDEAEHEARVGTVREMVAEALDQLVEMRRREGRALDDDLVRLREATLVELATIEERAPSVIEEYHGRLASRVERLLAGGKVELDRDAIAREVALYAERADISEEVVRLRAHLEHFAEVCAGSSSAGRKLDFLTQEMLREANTIGSKSNDARIARSVVEMKATIDRIKEQVQNVE